MGTRMLRHDEHLREPQPPLQEAAARAVKGPAAARGGIRHAQDSSELLTKRLFALDVDHPRIPPLVKQRHQVFHVETQADDQSWGPLPSGGVSRTSQRPFEAKWRRRDRCESIKHQYAAKQLLLTESF